MSDARCENCGCYLWEDGACPSCQEELCIEKQYEELEMETPELIFKKAREQEPEAERNLRNHI